MTIGICSLGWTGSGALVDLLNEYNEINDLCNKYDEFEFNFVYRPDGILDLKYHLFEGACRHTSSINAFNRFLKVVRSECGFHSQIQKLTHGKYENLSKEYIKQISQIEWKHYTLRDYSDGGVIKNLEGRVRYKIKRMLEKKGITFIDCFPLKNCYYSYKPEEFELITKKYIRDIIDAMIDEKDIGKIVMLDQPFPGDNPERSFPYFDDPCAIVVDRDPRDLYLLYKRVSFAFGHMFDDVNNFIIFYKKVRQNIPQNESNKVLRIRFEDLVYDYDKTKNRIESFLGIYQHSDIKKRFNPDISISNTQLVNRFPDEISNIRKIESELGEWLYPFNTSIKIDYKQKVF